MSGPVCGLWRFLRCVLCLWAACALAPACAQPVLHLSALTKSVSLIGQLEQLEDPTGRMSIAQVSAPGNAWQLVSRPAISWSLSHSAWWLRLNLRNDSSHWQSLVLDLQQPLLDEVDFYMLRENGEVQQHFATGDRRPFAQRPLHFHGLALPLRLEAGESRQVLVRISTHDGWFEPLEPVLSPIQAFTAHTEAQLLFQGLYFGALLTLAGYNLFLFISLRDRVFGLYVLYLLCFLVWGSTFRGLSFEYLWPDSPRLGNMMMTVSGGLATACAVVFAIFYLRLPERASPRLIRAGWLIAGVEVLLAALAPLAHYALSWSVLLPVALMGTLGMAATGLWQWAKGSREGMFYSLAFVPLMASMAALIMSVLGLLPTNVLGAYTWQLAALFEVGVLAIGLADSVQRMKAAKLRAEREARQAQQALTTQLESQVLDRTRALELANRKLQALAIQDELTGAFNRRHFNEVCRAALASPRRDEPVLLCMFDIDHFKSYNDHHGH
jgi:diguanylate cyclase